MAEQKQHTGSTSVNAAAESAVPDWVVYGEDQVSGDVSSAGTAEAQGGVGTVDARADAAHADGCQASVQHSVDESDMEAGIPRDVMRDLRKLNRKELLELLLVQSKRVDRLQAQLASTRAELAEREIRVSTAGTMAEASLALNGVFESIDAAGAQYLENLRNSVERQQRAVARLHDKEIALDAVITGNDPNIDPPTAKYIARLLEDAHLQPAESLIFYLGDGGQKEYVAND
jgi:hypothetical protein